MDKKKSQSYNYAMEALPILFHSQTSEFMKYLEKDGVKFLNFWWNHVGDQMPEEKRVTAGGISYTIEQIDQKTKLIIITLPAPKEDGDPYYLAFVSRPERRIAWVRIPTTEAYVLNRHDKCAEGSPTRFGYITPNGIYRERGIGLKPTQQDFKRIVKNKMNKKKTEKKK